MLHCTEAIDERCSMTQGSEKSNDMRNRDDRTTKLLLIHHRSDNFIGIMQFVMELYHSDWLRHPRQL